MPSITGRKVTGYAAIFDTRSVNLGGKSPWYEVVLPGAFPDLTKQDVRALLNHDPSLLLARSKFGKGTLKLSIDSRGLKYEFTAPSSSVGNDLVESLKRGDIDQSSFSFVVEKDKWVEEKGVRVRQIVKISSLLDISPVVYPAYNESSSQVRSKVASKNLTPLQWRLRLLEK